MKNRADSFGAAGYEPRFLGRRSQEPTSEVDRIPWAGGEIEVELICDEFTSLCPVTEQPDFGVLAVRYAPRNWLIETKSLKLYLWRFRDRGVFSERLVEEIAADLNEQIEPAWLEVRGEFNSRGGIAINVTARRGALS